MWCAFVTFEFYLFQINITNKRFFIRITCYFDKNRADWLQNLQYVVCIYIYSRAHVNKGPVIYVYYCK